MMKIYPDVPARFRSTLLRDLGVVAVVLLFAWFGYKTYQTIEELTILGSGVATAGTTIKDSFDSAAGAVGAIPFVGDDLSQALRRTGEGTGGELTALGQEGIERVHRLAVTTGLSVFGLPALLVLLILLPGRIRQVRWLTAADRVLDYPDDEDRRRLIAMRAAFALPYGTLLAHTPDPLGDLLAGNYDRLVDAALEDAGLRRPKRPRSQRFPPDTEVDHDRST